MKRLFAFDLVLLGYIAVVSAGVGAARPAGGALFLAYHAGAVALVALVVHAHARYGGRFWTFVRYWYLVPMVLAAFRELHFLIPAVRPFDDLRFDRQLAALDRRWFGDVEGFFLGLAHPLLVDALMLCYWSYFGLLVVPAAALYARGELAKVREYATALLGALLLSYLAYFLAPSVGPHHLSAARLPELDGWILARTLHEALMAIEWTMADAFPSGHAMATLTALVMAARLHPRSFRWLLAPGVGIVVATMALRYHYAVDVLAGVALVPPAAVAAVALHRRWEARVAGSISSLP